MATKPQYPSFRSGAIKQTKPRVMADEAGWFHYPCTCGASVPFRKRQRHAERVRCHRCLNGVVA